MIIRSMKVFNYQFRLQSKPDTNLTTNMKLNDLGNPLRRTRMSVNRNGLNRTKTGNLGRLHTKIENRGFLQNRPRVNGTGTTTINLPLTRIIPIARRLCPLTPNERGNGPGPLCPLLRHTREGSIKVSQTETGPLNTVSTGTYSVKNRHSPTVRQVRTVTPGPIILDNLTVMMNHLVKTTGRLKDRRPRVLMERRVNSKTIRLNGTANSIRNHFPEYP